MKVRYLPRAVADLSDVADYLTERNPSALAPSTRQSGSPSMCSAHFQQAAAR